jgi:hypothetical protein
LEEVGESSATIVVHHWPGKSRKFRRRQMASEQRPQGGQKDDQTWPDGVGVPSVDQPVLPSRQPVQIPTTFTRKKK